MINNVYKPVSGSRNQMVYPNADQFPQNEGLRSISSKDNIFEVYNRYRLLSEMTASSRTRSSLTKEQFLLANLLKRRMLAQNLHQSTANAYVSRSISMTDTRQVSRPCSQPKSSAIQRSSFTQHQEHYSSQKQQSHTFSKNTAFESYRKHAPFVTKSLPEPSVGSYPELLQKIESGTVITPTRSNTDAFFTNAPGTNISEATCYFKPSVLEESVVNKLPWDDLLAANQASRNDSLHTMAENPKLVSPTAKKPSTHQLSFQMDETDDSLVCEEIRKHVPGSMFYAMAQMKLCELKEEDKIGKYKIRKTGEIGLCCKHCGGKPGEGRYFPSSFDSFVNGTNPIKIVQHVTDKCKACPDDTKDAIKELKQYEATQARIKTRYGSRKQFFNHIWKLIQGKEQKSKFVSDASTTGTLNQDDSSSVMSSETVCAEGLLGLRSNSVRPAGDHSYGQRPLKKRRL